MTPAARIQAVIELVGEIERGEQPADVAVSRYARARRYIGGRDRREISTRVYGLLRRRARLAWRLGEGEAVDARRLVLADLVLSENLGAAEVGALFSGEGYAPAPLEPAESRLSATLAEAAGPEPDWVLANYPEWLDGELRRRFGTEVVAELRALNERAPVDLRVNTLRASPEKVAAALEAAGMAARPGRWAPHCLRLAERQRIAENPLYREGAVELQDEASQIAALFVEPAPRNQVVDFCAGAGGKTLALAALMGNSGQIYALDQSARRLAGLQPRLARAGVRNVQTRVLKAEREPWLEALEGRMDRVLVDAPCSGSGAWRRNPESRWRLDSEGLVKLQATQLRLLERAATLVRPGGRLVYSVCSVLLSEAEDVVASFQAVRPDFDVVPQAEVWRRALPGVEGAAGETAPYLLLTPARHGTDGFFVAVLARREADEGRAS